MSEWPIVALQDTTDVEDRTSETQKPSPGFDLAGRRLQTPTEKAGHQIPAILAPTMPWIAREGDDYGAYHPPVWPTAKISNTKKSFMGNSTTSPTSLKTINVEGLGDIQVPMSYGDAEIKQHVQQMQSIRQQTRWDAPLQMDFSKPSPLWAHTLATAERLPIPSPAQAKQFLSQYKAPAVEPDEITQPGDLLIRGIQAGREELAQKGGQVGSEIAARLATAQPQPGSMEAAAMRQTDPRTGQGMPPAPPPPEVMGVIRGAGGFAGSVAADPMTYLYGNLGALGRGGRIAAGVGFATQMGAGAVEQAGELGSILDRADIPAEKKYELGTQTVLQTIMAGVAGGHGVKEARGAVGDYLSRPSDRLAPSTPRMDPLGGEKIAPAATPTPTMPVTPKADTSQFAQAREEWQRRNPGEDWTKGANFSEVTRWAQMLKEGKGLPTAAQPTGTPESIVQIPPSDFLEKIGGIRKGAETEEQRNFRVNELMEGYKKGDPIPRPSITFDSQGNILDADGRHRAEAARRLGIERIPVEIHRRGEAVVGADTEPTVTPEGVHDLRSMSPEARHDWLNANAYIGVEGKSMAEAQAQADQLFGPGRKAVTAFIDTSGKTRYGVRSIPTGQPGVVSPMQPKSPLDTETAQHSYAKIQQLEGDFHQLTGGKHGEVLDALLAHVDNNLPPNSPPETRLNLYARGLRELKLALVKEGGLPGLAKAFDTAAQKTQAGVFAPVTGTKGLTQSQVDALNKLHVETMLDKWEGYPDSALVGRKVLKSLQDPAFQNSVANTGDPMHQARYDALLDRAGAAKASDPIAQLGRTLSNANLTAGALARGVLREGLATAAHSSVVQTKALESYVKDWNRRPLHDSIAFIDAIESGEINSITDPTDQAMAQKLRDMLDEKRQTVQGLGTGALDQFYEHYFPHVWKFGIKDLASQIVTGRRPLSGGQGFLRERTYNSFAEGIANGMEPVTYNPVTMALLKMHEMDRFTMAHTAFAELKSMGLVQQFGRAEVPEGWVRLNDRMFESKTVVKQGATSVDPATLAQTKAWYAPADAARPINNHLSPGLRGNAIFDSVAAYNNLLNQANLGLSAFHGVETAVNAVVSQQAVGLGKILRGEVSGVKDIATSIAAPISKYITGTRLLKEYMEPGRYAQMAGLANALDVAGGRTAMPSDFKNAAVEGMRTAWKETAAAPSGSFLQLAKGGKAVYRSLGAAMEKVSAPLMEYYVPRVKLGVFADMAQDTMERLGPNVSHEVLREELSKVWDSVDNRFGQVVYDNLFWNRMGKDIAHLTVRSVGWNMGTLRELGGSVWDVKDTARSGNLTPRQTYTLALLGTTAMMGYLINHAYGQKVERPVDLLYPKTGKIGMDGSPERIYLKTYVHDAYGFMHAPGQTATNKLAPIWHEVGDLYRNADYFDRQIHPIHATNLDAITDPKTYSGVLKYGATEALPFSATNLVQRHNQGESWLSAASSGLAVLPAPRWAGESKAESLAYSLYRTHLSRGPNDAEASERLQKYHQLATGYQAGTITPKDLSQALKNHIITDKQYDGIVDEKDGQLSPLQRHVKHLGDNEFLRVYDLASDSEKQSIKPQLLQHWDHVEEAEGPGSDLWKHYLERNKQLRQSGQKQ